jgi:hypothetical protein
MTSAPLTIDHLLTQLAENSRAELDLVRQLADAIRKVDDQILKEVRSVAMLHEVRREAVLSELQTLAVRLCALPMHGYQPSIEASSRPAIAQDPAPVDASPLPATGPETRPRAGDWRQAAQRIDDEMEQYFGPMGPRH